MQIVQKNNQNYFTPKNTNRVQSPLNNELCNKIYDEEFVSLINSLNESIKEYYKVSRNNIFEANNILKSYEQQAQAILNLMQEMINTSSYDRLEEFFNLIPKTLEVITQMKINSNSNNKNLSMFFDDAKILFKNMKSKRKEKLNDINNDMNRQYAQTPSDSYMTNFDTENKFNDIIDNNNSINNNKLNNNNDLLLKNINAIYSRVIKILNNFSIYNYIISKVDFEESNKYNNLQNSLKKEMEDLFIFLKKKLGNIQGKSLGQNKSSTNINDKMGNLRSKSRPRENKDLEQLKKINESYKKKLFECNNQLNLFRNKIRELEMKNNSMNMKIKNFEQNKFGFQNNFNQNNNLMHNPEVYNEINKKDLQIVNLQKQLKVFQMNENTLNEQINNLNDQFTQKINEYEYQIGSLSQTISLQKKNLANLQNNLNAKQKEIENLKGKGNNININNNNFELDKKIEMMNLELKEKQNKINSLSQDLKNYQRKELMNQEQIENMNNNIFNYEKIIKEKDDLINNNYKDNNEVFKIKLENEKLKKQIEELKNLSNNNYLQNQKMINGNINSYEMPEVRNQEYITKLNELTQEIQELKHSLALVNESKTKLDIEISKKNDELEAYKEVIFKLQNKLEQNNDVEEELKKRLTSERKNNNTEMNIREQNQSNKILNKSFEMPRDANIQLMNKYLGQLNEAEKKISQLQNKNKELQFKLDEKQVEKEFSGYRTEDYNFSNYEEEFDLKKMVNGAREKNRSEDINIDYPGVQSVKDKYKELLQNMHLLEEQVKILISNISITNKIKPQISQICQLMRIKAENIQAIIAGKDKKKNLGII
jgi:chromosome segregation ATPase